MPDVLTGVVMPLQGVRGVRVTVVRATTLTRDRRAGRGTRSGPARATVAAPGARAATPAPPPPARPIEETVMAARRRAPRGREPEVHATDVKTTGADASRRGMAHARRGRLRQEGLSRPRGVPACRTCRSEPPAPAARPARRSRSGTTGPAPAGRARGAARDERRARTATRGRTACSGPGCTRQTQPSPQGVARGPTGGRASRPLTATPRTAMAPDGRSYLLDRCWSVTDCHAPLARPVRRRCPL